MPLGFSTSASSPDVTLSNSDLTVTRNGTGWRSARTGFAAPPGMYYWEIRIDVASANYGIGLANAAADMGTYIGGTTESLGFFGVGGLLSNGGSVGSIPGLAFSSAGTIIGVAYNSTTGKLWVATNNTWSGDPAAGTGEAFASIPSDMFAAVTLYNEGNAITAHFADTDFAYSPPAGFSPHPTDDTPPVTALGPSLPVTAETAIRVYTASGVTVSLPETTLYLGGIYPEGYGFISGVITEKGTPDHPVRRKVRAHRKLDGQPIATTWSAEDGTYEFRPIPLGEYYIISFDHLDNFNAVIRDSIVAEPIT